MEQAAFAAAAAAAAPAVVRPPVALVRIRATGLAHHRRPVAQVPAQGVRRIGVTGRWQPAARKPAVVRHRVPVPVRAAVQDGRGDGREQAVRGRARGPAARGGRRRVHGRVRGTVQGRASGAELGAAAGQPHRAVRVRRRAGA